MKYLIILTLAFWCCFSSLAAPATKATVKLSAWDKFDIAGEKAWKKKNKAEAEKSWSQALKVAEKFKPWDPRLTTSLDNMAKVYKAEGKYKDAEKLYRRSLTLRKKHLLKGDPVLGLSVINLASTYSAMGEYKKAKELYTKEHDIAESAAASKCYLCEEDSSVIPIFYGEPTPAVAAMAKKGHIKLGGPADKKNYRWYCIGCEAPL